MAWKRGKKKEEQKKATHEEAKRVLSVAPRHKRKSVAGLDAAAIRNDGCTAAWLLANHQLDGAVAPAGKAVRRALPTADIAVRHHGVSNEAAHRKYGERD
jgi:hypothetical protein